MTPAELRAVSRLGGHAFAGVVSRIERVHQAVAGRAFGPIRHAGAPARFIHDSVSRSVYLAVRSTGSAAGAIFGEVLSPLGAGGQPTSSTPTGNLALSALNAIAGDRLRPDVAPLAIRMAVRAGGRDVDLVAQDLAAAFPDATPRLAVFVHGLAETENSWDPRSDESVSYGQRLRADLGYSPVYIRYSTGRHVSDNGQDLAGLLDRLTASVANAGGGGPADRPLHGRPGNSQRVSLRPAIIDGVGAASPSRLLPRFAAPWCPAGPRGRVRRLGSGPGGRNKAVRDPGQRIEFWHQGSAVRLPAPRRLGGL